MLVAVENTFQKESLAAISLQMSEGIQQSFHFGQPSLNVSLLPPHRKEPITVSACPLEMLEDILTNFWLGSIHSLSTFHHLLSRLV